MIQPVELHLPIEHRCRLPRARGQTTAAFRVERERDDRIRHRVDVERADGNAVVLIAQMIGYTARDRYPCDAELVCDATVCREKSARVCK